MSARSREPKKPDRRGGRRPNSRRTSDKLADKLAKNFAARHGFTTWICMGYEYGCEWRLDRPFSWCEECRAEHLDDLDALK